MTALHPLNSYGAFISYVKQHDGGKSYGEIKNTCKKMVQHSAVGRTPKWQKDYLLQGIFNELALKIGIYKEQQASCKEASFTLDATYYPNCNQVIQGVVIDILKTEGMRAEVGFRDYTRFEVKIKGN